MIQNVKEALVRQFAMIDLDLLHYFIGLQVHQYSGGITIFHKIDAINLLKHFGRAKYKYVPTPFQSSVTLTTNFTSP